MQINAKKHLEKYFDVRYNKRKNGKECFLWQTILTLLWKTKKKR